MAEGKVVIRVNMNWDYLSKIAAEGKEKKQRRYEAMSIFIPGFGF